MQSSSATVPARADGSVVLRAVVVVSLLLGCLALAAEGLGLASSGDVRLWAVNAGWTLAGVVALGGTLSAALRLERGTRVQRAWLLWAAAAACWLIGALVQDGVATTRLSPAATAFWLAFALFGIAGSAYRIPPGFLFRLFLLDALPVVLLAVAAVRVASEHPLDSHVWHETFLNLYPVLYGILAALAVQVFGILRGLRRDSETIWLLTLGFGLTGLAALFWVPAAAASGTAQGHWADPLWTLGLLVLALASLLRARSPGGYVDVPPLEKGTGLHALASAGATLALIVMMIVFSKRYEWLFDPLVLVAALALSARFYLARRESENLYAQSRAQQEQLVAQNEHLRELDSLKDEFVALVSHELRTPLTSIIGYLELVQDPATGELSKEQRKFTGIIERNAERLLHLVRDLLLLAQVQSGKLTLDLGEVDLAALAEDAVEAARPAAERRQIDLTLTAEPVPALAGDHTRLAQLLDNLLSNALKFTPEEGRVEISVKTKGESALLEVADNGMGIPADDQAQLFERFFRTTAATDNGIQGTGLGLAITKAITDAHHGTISVKSEEGHGTVFRVQLPLRQTETPATPDPAQQHRPSTMNPHDTERKLSPARRTLKGVTTIAKSHDERAILDR